MKITNLIEILKAKAVSVNDIDKEISGGGYVGDFLSFVMGKAPEDSAWFTVMTNINVAAVAHLTGVAVVVVCEGVKAEEQLIAKCKMQKINLIETDLNAYEAATAFFRHENIL